MRYVEKVWMKFALFGEAWDKVTGVTGLNNFPQSTHKLSTQIRYFSTRHPGLVPQIHRPYNYYSLNKHKELLL